MKKKGNKMTDKTEAEIYRAIKDGVLEVSSDGTKTLNLFRLINTDYGRAKLREIMGDESIVIQQDKALVSRSVDVEGIKEKLNVITNGYMGTKDRFKKRDESIIDFVIDHLKEQGVIR